MNHIEKKLARIGGFRRDLVSISLVLALVLLMTFAAVPVLAPAIISWPEGTMEVPPGENFTFRHRLRWDEAAPGFYVITIYWDYGGDNSWHFTLVENRAYFDNGDPIEATASVKDDGSRYTIGVVALAGDMRDGYFTVDITLRASGPDGSPHRAGDHSISYIAIRCYEESVRIEYPAPVTVRVPGRGVAVSISPSENSGPPGATLRHTVNIKNLGSIEDTFTFEVVSDADWSVNIEPTSLTLAAGATGEATLNVVVPPDAGENASMTVVVKATSTGDPTVSNSGTCETVASEETPEEPSPTVWPAVLAVLIAVAILVGGYALYSIFKAGQRKQKRKRTLRA